MTIPEELEILDIEPVPGIVEFENAEGATIFQQFHNINFQIQNSDDKQ